MAWFLYILFCDKKKYYVGITDNISRRLEQHRGKRSFYTKQFSNIELIYTEGFKTRKEAEIRETQIKGWSVAKKRALICNNFSELKKLSRSHKIGESHSRR